jgi:hypothetical protein
MAEFASKGTLKSGKQLLLEFANDESIPQALRISAAMAHAKYEPAYLPSEVHYPKFETVEEAEAFKQELIQREGRKELDTDTASMALERLDNIIADKRADAHAARQDIELELKRLAADASDQPQIIQITGGLPTLPGTNVTMPSVNGHAQTDLLPPASVPQTMVTKGDGFIFTWIQGRDGKWELQDKTLDPAFASAGPALRGTTED